MLRSRLYIGMLPVAGLLIAICIYSIVNFNRLTNRLERLQTDHYSAISTIERILVAAGQIERAVRLKGDGDIELANRVLDRGTESLRSWLEAHPKQPESDDAEEASLQQHIRSLLSLSQASVDDQHTSDSSVTLGALLDSIEADAITAIAKRNDSILQSNLYFKRQSQIHYAIVVAGIIASIVLMAIVAYLLSQRILAPIDALTQAARDLASDRWEIEFQPRSKDEIATLEKAFSDMAGSISRYKKMTNREIARTRRRMEECFSNLPHPVMFFDSSKQLLYSNPQADILIDKLNWKTALPPYIEQSISSVFGTGMEKLSTDLDESVSIEIENEEQHYLPLVLRIDNEELADIECAVILQDVTNLRLSDELKSDMVATVSHEIKTPVTSATMALLLVLEGSLGDLNEEQVDMLSTAKMDLERLKRILDHLLEIARLEFSSPKLSIEDVKPAELIQSVIEGHSIPAVGKSISLSANIDAALTTMKADPKALDIALSNYLSNAIKYSPSNSKVVIYAKYLDPERRTIRLGVLDRGPGLPPSDTRKVFEKFYRATDKSDGVGFGLSIVKDLAHAQNGHAQCELRPGGGCDFYIELPADPDSVYESKIPVL